MNICSLFKAQQSTNSIYLFEFAAITFVVKLVCQIIFFATKPYFQLPTPIVNQGAPHIIHQLTYSISYILAEFNTSLYLSICTTLYCLTESPISVRPVHWLTFVHIAIMHCHLSCSICRTCKSDMSSTVLGSSWNDVQLPST